jgi:hypothetical protein
MSGAFTTERLSCVCPSVPFQGTWVHCILEVDRRADAAGNSSTALSAQNRCSHRSMGHVRRHSDFTNQENGFDSREGAVILLPFTAPQSGYGAHPEPPFCNGRPQTLSPRGKRPGVTVATHLHPVPRSRIPRQKTAGARQMQIHKQDKNIRKQKTIKTYHQNLIISPFLFEKKSPMG